MDLGHELLVCVVICLTSLKTNLCEHYFPEIFVGVGFMMARTISYTLTCSVTEMKFKQFQPSVIVFNVGYTSKPSLIQFSSSSGISFQWLPASTP